MKMNKMSSFRKVNEVSTGERIVNWALGLLAFSTVVLLSVFLLKH